MELAGFTSLGFDDHIKLIVPSGSESTGETLMRDYTPRFDAAAQVLNVDFALHESGPATAWAMRAKVGDTLLIAGPRGSAIIPMNFDWHLLIGDETGLPAIGRRLEELPVGSRAVVFAEVDNEHERQVLASKAQVIEHWIYRHGSAAGTGELLLAALRAAELPSGEFFAWAAAESSVVRVLRRALIDECGANRSWVKAAGYWKRGSGSRSR